MAKILKYEKHVDVDRGKGVVLFQRDIKPVKKGEPIYSVPAKDFIPRDEERLVGVDAAYYYLECKNEEYAENEEDVRRGIFAAAFYMGMCAMATLFLALGYFKV
jgi:hypothetical protein